MNRTAVEEIKARLPIEEIVGQYVKLEKAGKSYKAKCPFHNEKSASFFISPDRGGYYCFGCNAKGDIFTFVEQFEGLDFKGALKILAEKAGVNIAYDQKTDSERDILLRIMEEATLYFEGEFTKSKEAQDYVKSRGISDVTRKEFRIGWAPDGWRNLNGYLKEKKYPEVLMEKAGLIKKSDSGKDMYDRFRGRIIFPISDSSGRVVAFSGRILKSDDTSPKYLNSPDTPLYDKSAILYGLDKAKSEIRRLNYTIMVEGQMDLVMSHQAGIKNTIAASGTALTDEVLSKSGVISNLGLIRRLSPNVIIAFDSDSAGKKAALRAAEIALGMGMDVKVADITGGKDPADLVSENVDNWKAVLRNAKQVIEFELNNVSREFTDSRKLSKAVQQKILPLLAQIESNSDQSFFVAMIADKAKIPIDSVWQDLRIITQRLKQESVTKPVYTSGNYSNKKGPSVRTSSEVIKRINIVERRIFGLLSLMEKENSSNAAEYRAKVRAITGDSYTERSLAAEAAIDDILFEAEAFFGHDKENWDKHMNELLINFEEDLVSEELIQAMQELKAAEQAGNSVLLAELAKKCQVLSLRKSEIGKKRKL
jgi:DNA primase